MSTKQKHDKCWISVEVDRRVRDALAAKADKLDLSLAQHVRRVLTRAAAK